MQGRVLVLRDRAGRIPVSGAAASTRAVPLCEAVSLGLAMLSESLTATSCKATQRRIAAAYPEGHI